jgi:pimeloyl-ACP methyl ester carboxylesterase
MKTTTRLPFMTIISSLLLLFILPAESVFSDPASGNREHIVLVHGFGRTGHDMRFLAAYFTKYGYEVSIPTLPAFFGTFDNCTAALESHIESLDGNYTRIHLVGHSLGGLVIRNMLSRKAIPRLGRCLLIATPNSGSPLAGIVARWIKPLYWAVPLYGTLQPDGVDISAPLNNPAPDIGVIAGDKNALMFGRLLDSPADGCVPLDSVPFDGMAEFIVVPFHHEEIHHREETARLTREFIETGIFLSKAP